MGHYPKAGWLRVACSYVKRHAEGDSWDDYVGDGIRDRLKEIVEEVMKNDPVKGVWRVPKSDSGTVWCDASNLAMGVVLEIGGTEVEDTLWMRKKEYNHINVAELEAVLKGINLCAKWNLKDVVLVTDAATVFGWIELTLTEEKKVKTKGAAEILVKRRSGILKTLIPELGLTLTVKLVKSEENKADTVTRVRKRWLVPEMGVGCAALEEVKKMHDEHHMGVERTCYLAKRSDKSAEKETVKAVVRQCQSIDPAPTSHTPGELGVQEAWSRLAIDVIHYAGRPYLSMVDCGPGRFVVWRELKGETATEICHELDELFYERGQVDELFMDNALAFRSQEMLQLMEKWGVRPFYRAAYRARGNGIVERSHRTIKTMAERSGKSPIDAVFWYNVAPRYGQPASVPQKSVATYEWRLPVMSVPPTEEGDCGDGRVQIGEEVWVRPGGARCTTRWGRGNVTGMNSANNIEVDGVPRHILDVRPVVEEVPEGLTANVEEDEIRRYPRQDRHVPAWMRDYVSE